MAPSLTDFKALSFDCYGTLIDWESGIFKQLRPLLDQLPPDNPYQIQDKVISRFNEYQGRIEREHPTLLYSDVLATCYKLIAKECKLQVSDSDAATFGKSVGEWKAFDDTVAGLQILKKYYKLFILSNVDNENVRDTLQGPLSGVKFDAVLTAESIGSYKPDHKNFQMLSNLIDQNFEIAKNLHLHVAKSLPVDHVPAKELGLTSAWIARGADGVSAMGGDLKNFEDRVSFTWRFASIGEMAEEVEKAFAGRV